MAANGSCNHHPIDEVVAAEDTSLLKKESNCFEKSNGRINVQRKLRALSLSGETNEPVVITIEDIIAASYKIRHGIKKTPCELSRMSDLLGMDVYFKKDYLQYTGSFKERGARFTLQMLPPEQKEKGVIAASAGNHALALSYHGKLLGIPVTVVMPTNAPMMKISLCKKYGATVHVTGDDLIEAKEVALKIGRANGLQYINGYDHPHILAGQGTMALEIIEQMENVDFDAVLIPVGGGGLLAGCAVAFKTLMPDVKVYGVESVKCASFTAAMEAGHPVKIDSNQSLTLADGLCVAKVGSNALQTCKDIIDGIITVSEEYIALAVLRLIEEEKAVVEGAGATALAACLAGLVPQFKGKKIIVPLCGGNIDSTVLGRCIERGLAADGRLCRCIVTVSDRPGGIAELTRLCGSLGASVKDIFHERAWLQSSIFSVQIRMTLEVRDSEHGQKLKEALEAQYEEVLWGEDKAFSLKRPNQL